MPHLKMLNRILKNMGFMIAYEKDTSTDKSKKYFVNTEQGLIQATILNLS